ncbi:type IV toxin-antitoxin system AbiEi family antitoxin domain-containing protein [Actinopolymorpha sp. NPDC004070]|uniref:type IV toxin-antitoxin system AbiEi family antitoxin domain-containing protein n=1 Tax=Actinopolymorpha sp. NPDC004070 TaxID=3154548 RepID=UPI0033B0D132
MPTPLPQLLLETIEKQAGVVLLEQVRGCGMTPDQVRARVESGRWQRLFPRVYLTHGGPAQRPSSRWAALLYAGTDALLSHGTAAELWGLLDGPVVANAPVDVTVPKERRVRPQPGLCLHYSTRVAAIRHPTRVPPRTRVEDTVLDLAATTERFPDIVALVCSACQRRLTTPARLRAALAARPNTPWRASLRTMLAEVGTGAQSPLELAYLRSVERAHGLPRGTRQAHRRTNSISQWMDVRYDEYLLVVELDGRLGHVGDGAFRDRRRDNLAAESGYWTLRYGWAETIGRPCGVAEQVALVLRQRGWRGRLRACRRCGDSENTSWGDLRVP